jgi:hypothetical protein
VREFYCKKGLSAEKNNVGTTPAVVAKGKKEKQQPGKR